MFMATTQNGTGSSIRWGDFCSVMLSPSIFSILFCAPYCETHFVSSFWTMSHKHVLFSDFFHNQDG